MKVLIIGCGLVGRELAKQLKADGHTVVGTTTTPGKVASLSDVCSEVKVLRGSDTELVHEAAKGCDAIAVCAGPAAQQAMTPEQRKASYHKVLVETAHSAATAPITGPVIALSSFSVYGDAGSDSDVIDEDARLTTADDASPACFQQAERMYLEHAGERACIFRCSDIMGGDDPPIADKIRMAHQLLKGSVPFHDEALFYRVDMLDVVAAVKFALDEGIKGIYNITHEEVPPTNKAFFDAIGATIDLPSLSYRNELRMPTKPVSAQRLLATGFKLTHTKAERLPKAGEQAVSVTAKPKKELNLAGRKLALAALERIKSTFDLKEVKGDGDDGAFMTIKAVGGPLDGKTVGEMRVFQGGPIHKLVYSKMTIGDFGMDTHQIYAYTAPDSELPHLFVDVAISPNTDSTFHVGIDMIPRVDLGANVAYMQELFVPLSQTQKDAMAVPGVMVAESVGPMHYALRSPWMVAAFVQNDSMPGCEGFRDAYVDHWIKLLQDGVSPAVKDEVAGQDVSTRDKRNRAAQFSPKTNPVWMILGRLVGEEQSARMRDILASQDIG